MFEKLNNSKINLFLILKNLILFCRFKTFSQVIKKIQIKIDVIFFNLSVIKKSLLSKELNIKKNNILSKKPI
jgi:hypothetical protein